MRTLTPLTVLLTVAALAIRGDDKTPRAGRDKVLRRFADEFVTLTPGKGVFPASFTMGGEAANEKPAHEVKLGGPFALNRYEVTQELYEAVMVKNPSKWQGPRNSVEMVSWDEAHEFCRKASAELRTRKLLGDDEVIRLPTESEWEYACRAGSTTKYAFGDKDGELKDYAWFKGNSKGEDPPVGKKKPNAWGLFDMHGYVWEWTADAWHDNYKGAPRTAEPGTKRGRRSACSAAVRGPTAPTPAARRTGSTRKPASRAIRLASAVFGRNRTSHR